MNENEIRISESSNIDRCETTQSIPEHTATEPVTATELLTVATAILSAMRMLRTSQHGRQAEVMQALSTSMELISSKIGNIHNRTP